MKAQELIVSCCYTNDGAFIQDIVMSMFDEGAVAIVPVDTSSDPRISSSYDILSMRTGKIIEWYPAHVKVRLYNERTGKKEDILPGLLYKTTSCQTLTDKQ